MTRTRTGLVALVGIAVLSATALGQGALTNAFTYQGRLTQIGGDPNQADFQFSLWSDPTSTGPLNRIGATQTVLGQPLDDGLFTVTLNANNEFGLVPFGHGILPGQGRWLEIAVRVPGNPGYTTLTPRQPLRGVPFALALRGVVVDDQLNVGVGRQVGGYKFRVDAEAAAGGGAQIENSFADPVNAHALLSIWSPWGADTYLRFQSNQGLWAAGVDGSDAKKFKIASNASVGTNDRLTIQTDGAVGVGTSTPGRKLDVNGTVRVSGSDSFWTNNGWRRALELSQADTILWQRGASGVARGVGSSTDGVLYISRANVNDNSGPATYDMVVDTLGRVGIARTNPTHALDVDGPARVRGNVNTNLLLTGSGDDIYLDFRKDSDTDPNVSARILFDGFTSQTDHRGAIEFFTRASGDASPQKRLRLNENGNLEMFDGANTNLEIRPEFSAGGNDLWMSLRHAGAERISFAARNGNTGFGGLIQVRNRNGAVTCQMIGDVGDPNASGRVVASVLEITGGSDLSEGFEVAGDDVQPGMVVVIDPENPGRLKPSADAYDRRVAGVISGAGGVRPGMLMGQSGTIAAGRHPVALSGRVYVLADARERAIEPGDLLTTAAQRGHVMPVEDHARAQGAIVGKAMTGLRKGESGLILVLVNLQ